MMKSLLFISLLAFNCSIPKQVEIQPEYSPVVLEETEYIYKDKKNNLNGINNSVYGLYNFKNYFDHDGFDPTDVSATSVDIQFYDSSLDSNPNKFNCPIVFQDDDRELFLSRINFTYLPSFDYLRIYFYCYTSWAENVFKSGSFHYDSGDYINVQTNLTSIASVYFNIKTLVILDAEQSTMFNNVFTSDENYYVKNYTGYYSFTSNLNSIPSAFTVLGSVFFNNSIYNGFTNRQHSTYSSTILTFYNYDVDNGYFDYVEMNLPFNSNEVISSNSILTGCKMHYSTYTVLSNVGIFGYVPPNTQPATFQDLLFSVMDAPVYFLSKLLSFQLFGVNMFVAFTGLLTICMILLLIRKFF